MPVLRIKKDALPPRRWRGRFVQELPEWKDLWAMLGGGLAPQEAVQVVLSLESRARFNTKSPTQNFLKAIKDHLKQLGLKYDAYEAEGIICIVGR